MYLVLTGENAHTSFQTSGGKHRRCGTPAFIGKDYLLADTAGCGFNKFMGFRMNGICNIFVLQPVIKYLDRHIREIAGHSRKSTFNNRIKLLALRTIEITNSGLDCNVDAVLFFFK